MFASLQRLIVIIIDDFIEGEGAESVSGSNSSVFLSRGDAVGTAQRPRYGSGMTVTGHKVARRRRQLLASMVVVLTDDGGSYPRLS